MRCEKHREQKRYSHVLKVCDKPNGALQAQTPPGRAPFKELY